MEIFLAKSAGFCFGVSKAVNTTCRLVKDGIKPIYTLGPIIHNDQVVKQLESSGVKTVASLNEMENKDGVIVIRAHGVVPEIYENAQKSGIKLIDATCPYVKKIHKLVSERHAKGDQIIIVGDKNHPEVIGINGWCENKAFVVDSSEDINNLQNLDKNICVVAQTTITKEKWKMALSELEKKYDKITFFDTICSATSTRQSEAAEIASKVDIMFIIGGKNSSNTEKLYQICKKYCNETYKIETSGDIPPFDKKIYKKIGITAGASTPDWIIKEVINNMSQENQNEMSFQELLDNSLKTLRSGEVVKGKIIDFNNSEVYVDLGYKSDGVIPAEEFINENQDLSNIKIGDEIEALILRVNDKEGKIELSKRKVDAIKGWDNIYKAFENSTPITAKIIEAVNGGVIAISSGIRIFIPASQLDIKFVKDLSEYVGKQVDIKILEANRHKKRVVGSSRALLEAKKAEEENKIWSEIEPGKVFTGKVKSLTNFGAFVDIGGVDGLVHITELSWNRIKHPSEVVKVGDTVEVTILEADREKKKISLGYRKSKDNPWEIAKHKYNVGDIVKGKVVRLVPFGAFIELDEGVDGLVHISQIATVRLSKPQDVLTVGQEIQAKIVEMDVDNKKIGLSIKEVQPINPVSKEEPKQEVKAEGESEEELPTSHNEDMGVTLGDLIDPDKK